MNISWKLKEILRNGASETLLESYQIERYHHVKKYIDLTIQMGQMINQTTSAIVAGNARTRIVVASEGIRAPCTIQRFNRDGRTLVDSREVSLVELERLARSGLAAAPDGEPFDVLIRPDRNAPARELDRVLSRLAATGIDRWKLGTVEPGSGGGG